MFRLLLPGAAFMGLASALVAQGPLSPPGAPAPIMRSLDQIEPRTPISSLPFTISASGSYYLTKDLTGVSGQSGITVSADNVTLDLNGFALIGVAGSIHGIVLPIGLANLVLHGIDEPHIWHGNALSQIPVYGGLFAGAPQFFDYVLMNPPFGGKEGKEAQTPYEYKTGATQVLFILNVLQSMKRESRCGIVLDEGVLFRVDAEAFVQTKRKLLEECDVYCIVSLPGGVFSSAGAGVKTNLVFFDKGRQTERIWYYDLSQIKVGKKTPLTLAHFEEFFLLLPDRTEKGREADAALSRLRSLLSA